MASASLIQSRQAAQDRSDSCVGPRAGINILTTDPELGYLKSSSVVIKLLKGIEQIVERMQHGVNFWNQCQQCAIIAGGYNLTCGKDGR